MMLKQLAGLLCLLLLLSGCGQKGDLYLPEPQTSAAAISSNP